MLKSIAEYFEKQNHQDDLKKISQKLNFITESLILNPKPFDQAKCQFFIENDVLECAKYFYNGEIEEYLRKRAQILESENFLTIAPELKKILLKLDLEFRIYQNNFSAARKILNSLQFYSKFDFLYYKCYLELLESDFSSLEESLAEIINTREENKNSIDSVRYFLHFLGQLIFIGKLCSLRKGGYRRFSVWVENLNSN